MISVLLADDQPLVRAGIRSLLDSTDDITVVGEAATGAEAVSGVRHDRPDVVLMDIRMPELDGLEATRRILSDSRPTDTRVVMLTTFDVDEYVYAALRSGASGFLLKDADPDELRHAVRVVASGDALIAPAVTRRLIKEFVSMPTGEPPTHRLADLTDREREVLTGVAAGSSNADIASSLHMSPATVKTHVNRIMTKLSAHDRAQLVIVGYETGLVRPGWT